MTTSKYSNSGTVRVLAIVAGLLAVIDIALLSVALTK